MKNFVKILCLSKFAKTFQERLEGINSQVEDIQAQVEKSRAQRSFELIEELKTGLDTTETQIKKTWRV